MKFCMFSMFALALLSCELTTPHEVLERTAAIQNPDEREWVESLLVAMITGNDAALATMLDEMENSEDFKWAREEA